MTIDEIRKLKWDHLSEYIWENQVPTTDIGKLNKKYASREDIEAFTSDHICITARELNVDYNEFQKLVKDENKAFYAFLDVVYETWSGLGKKSEDFKKLRQFFRLPIIPDKYSNPVNDILLRFEKLNNIQKIEVLEKLKLITVNVNTLHESETTSHIL